MGRFLVGGVPSQVAACGCIASTVNSSWHIGHGINPTSGLLSV